MPRKFDETVAKVRERIQRGHVVLDERVRAGKKRKISVGPYRYATGEKVYAFCVLPALPGGVDCKDAKSADRTAREFVRFVGVENARDALVRESRKRGS